MRSFSTERGMHAVQFLSLARMQPKPHGSVSKAVHNAADSIEPD